jgi:hypothetical protein
MAEGITGKALYELLKPLRPAYALNDWNEIHPTSQTLHAEIAEKLHQQYLVPLQGLVRDYRALTAEVYDAATVAFDDGLNYVCMDAGWEEELNALNMRAKQLLDEGEVKAGAMSPNEKSEQSFI